MIIEINATNPITSEGQPDGGLIPIVDPYDGCQLCCPYCFQWSDTNWNKDIYVKMNIAKLLDRQLEKWPKSDTIYIGSRCDPYMPLEGKYHLTRSCLEIINKWHIPVMITTKSDNNLILRDLDIFKKFHVPLTILMGLSNINQADKGADNHNIKVANTLCQMGIDVWVFITPVLPYIMDINAMITALDPKIPVFSDKLRTFSDSIQIEKMLHFIKTKYPHLIKQYTDILYHGDECYYEELKQKYHKDTRIQFLFC